MTKQFARVKLNCLSVLGVSMFIVGSLLNFVNSQSIANECGSINLPEGLLMEGNQTRKGFWPFAVTIYEIQNHRLFCGGTLITRKHVLTAAHCIQYKSIGLKYAPADIAVLLGAYVLLAKSEGGVEHVNVTDIRVHPDWEDFSKSTLDADVAILVLNHSATLRSDIQIVCLPADDDVIDNGEGFVVGWDFVQQTPKHFVIKVLNSSYCHSEILTLNGTFSLSQRTFCGGAEVVSLTKKVSGGGFFMRTGSAWVQHGIALSVTNATGKTIVFLMKVNSFKNWIVETVRQSGGVVGEAVKGKVNLNCEFIDLYYSYACLAHGLNVLSTNFVVDHLVGSNKSESNNSKVELLQFHDGTMLYFLNGIGISFPNLKSIFVGYSDSSPMHTKLIGRSNFQNMENVFEIVIHKSDIETITEDVLWDLPNLERFQLDGQLKEIPEKTFKQNAKLKEVYLATNALEFLPRKLFKNNPNLSWVNFEDNLLKFIETDFYRLRNIQYIFLAGNVCIDTFFNRTVQQPSTDEDDQNDYINERLMEFQRLIYLNCTFVP